jgi:alkylation response protein AidB-like acyl-CoA dehydrogenase
VTGGIGRPAAASTGTEGESVADFGADVRRWLGELGFRRADQTKDSPEWADDTPEFIANARAFQRAAFDGGFAGLSWPTEYGGHAMPVVYELIYQQELLAYELPTRPFVRGFGMCGPTILAAGTEEQKRQLIPRLLRGEDIWAQLFSEPEAGSDLANLRTRASSEGDGWRISGEKVWSSGAAYADRALLLARTDASRPKHRGLTMFVVDMRAPGIEVRPIRQITGSAKFAQVFFNDVSIPDSNRIGELNDGWRCAHGTLESERFAVSGRRSSQRGGTAAQLVNHAVNSGLAGDAVVRDRIADVITREWVLDRVSDELIGRRLDGMSSGANGSVLKLLTSQLLRITSALGMDLAGSGAMAWASDDPSAGRWSLNACGTVGLLSGAGTDDVLRNVIAERILHLPRDRSPDTDVPFHEAKTGRAQIS